MTLRDGLAVDEALLLLDSEEIDDDAFVIVRTGATRGGARGARFSEAASVLPHCAQRTVGTLEDASGGPLPHERAGHATDLQQG